MGKQVRISKGNSKMGNIPHINLPPCRSCDRTLPCYSGGCYSLKAYRMYPNVRESWDANWEMVANERDAYFRKINEWLARHKPEYFRWHAAGDIPDGDYLDRMFSIARFHPGTKFLAFTKRYELVKEAFGRIRWVRKADRVDNLAIVLSVWPYLPIDRKLLKRFPAAYMFDPKDPDERIPAKARDCTGECDKCLLCWSLAPGDSVKFHKH